MRLQTVGDFLSDPSYRWDFYSKKSRFISAGSYLSGCPMPLIPQNPVWIQSRHLSTAGTISVYSVTGASLATTTGSYYTSAYTIGTPSLGFVAMPNGNYYFPVFQEESGKVTKFRVLKWDGSTISTAYSKTFDTSTAYTGSTRYLYITYSPTDGYLYVSYTIRRLGVDYVWEYGGVILDPSDDSEIDSSHNTGVTGGYAYLYGPIIPMGTYSFMRYTTSGVDYIVRTALGSVPTSAGTVLNAGGNIVSMDEDDVYLVESTTYSAYVQIETFDDGTTTWPIDVRLKGYGSPFCIDGTSAPFTIAYTSGAIFTLDAGGGVTMVQDRQTTGTGYDLRLPYAYMNRYIRPLHPVAGYLCSFATKWVDVG